MTKAQKKMLAARTALIFDQPFFGALALRLKLIEDPTCKTAWTNGYHLGYSPEYISQLSHEGVVALIAHEVMHCAMGHPWRRGGRHHKKFNVAADYAINPELERAKFAVQPTWLNDPQFAGKSAEWVYDRLPEPQDGEGGDGSGQPGSGNGDEPTPGAGAPDVRDAPTGDEEGAGVTPQDWKQATAQAAAAAKARGQLPSHLQRFVDQVTKPKVDWRSVLRRFIQQVAQTDYTWSRPNTRYLPSGLYLPSLRSESMGPIAVAVDTSGSVDNVTLARFASEVEAIVGEAKPERTHVIYCDAAVQGHDVFEPGDPVEFKNVAGGGGTDFRPAVLDAQELDDDPVCLIYLTDMYGTFPEQAPEFPVLWVSVSEITEAPFGEVVPIA